MIFAYPLALYADRLFRRAHMRLMYATASGVLQEVSPWSTTTGPMRRAALDATGSAGFTMGWVALGGG